jgi:ectoine hydroxylase-related dioxygenase (phytanoyl-CoA dioxygenase family)
MGMVLEELLGDEPAICNTLNFTKGSQQADHLDTLYMTPPDEHGLVATWMALEDAQEGSGPLRYYPGSHRIKPYRFTDGRLHTVPDEMSLWSDYMAEQVERHGLKDEVFYAKKGDLFIWSAFLLHGGSAIAQPQLSRQSLVTHYWTQSQCDTNGWSLRPAQGGWWILKPHLDVPGAGPPRPLEVDEVEEPDFPAALSVSDPAQVDGDLRERMDALQGALD